MEPASCFIVDGQDRSFEVCAMRKDEEYRANAAECHRMARVARESRDRQTWLEMAESWLRMIREPDRSESNKFDDAEKAQGTGQNKSTAEH
jgi:hypothetical protein